MTSVTSKPSLTKDGDGCIRITGAILGGDILGLRQEGEAWLQSTPASNCEIDLSGVSNASSVLLSLMLCWKRAAQARQIGLRFAGASERLTNLAVMSHVADHLGLTTH